MLLYPSGSFSSSQRHRGWGNGLLLMLLYPSGSFSSNQGLRGGENGLLLMLLYPTGSFSSNQRHRGGGMVSAAQLQQRGHLEYMLNSDSSGGTSGYMQNKTAAAAGDVWVYAT